MPLSTGFMTKPLRPAPDATRSSGMECCVRRPRRMLLGEAGVGTALAGLASATDGESPLPASLEEAEDMAAIGQRLADTPLSESIPHAQVEPEMHE